MIMTDTLTTKYPHLTFRRDWQYTQKSLLLLGQCEALVKAICNTPILPEHHSQLLNVSLIKGAQATTAIEGNTLTEVEIQKIKEGQKLPLSKEYQEIEVNNILQAFQELFDEVVSQNTSSLITKDFIRRLHLMVGKSLGDHLEAIPGRFRDRNVVVGTYRCPESDDVEYLIELLCDWLLKEFHFDRGNQTFTDVVIQAIISHVYIEWIHPFGDGNGRTGRLLEFYILLRGGNPDIASHILSNHYNETRPEYYRQLENATRKRSLTDFIEYALQGFQDGLVETLEVIQLSQSRITWERHIYNTFDKTNISNNKVFKRRRNLILELPIEQMFSINEIVLATAKIARDFANLSPKTVQRDLEDLIEMKLIVKEGNKYKANFTIIKNLVARKKLSC
jgi:Fic family protein